MLTFLREVEQGMKPLLDSIGDGLVVTDERGTPLFWNATAERILGEAALRPQDGLWVERPGVFASDGVTPISGKDRPILRAIRGEMVTGEEITIRSPRGDLVFVSCTARALRDPTERIVGSVAIFRDITERRRMDQERETQLAERERWLSAILLSIGDAVIVTDTSGVITVMNTVAEALTGWKGGAAIGRSLGEVFRLIDSAEEPAESIADGPLLVRSDGSLMPVSETRATIRDRHGGVAGAVLVFRDMTKERAEKQRLGALVLLDPLTGIPNRRALELRLNQELTRSRRYNRPLSCLMVDIDAFKSINDHHGHTLGDSVLALVAQLLPRETRAEVDLVARYGGEEFVVILPETPLAGAIVTAERLRAKVESAWIAPRGLQVTLSIGVATGATEDLIVRADRAMYLAKRNGRNRVEVWDETTCGLPAVRARS